MQKEFNKASKPLNKSDFETSPTGSLSLLVEANENFTAPPAGVTIQSKLGNFFTAEVTYEGAKALDRDDGIIRMDFSRTGGVL